VPPARQLLAPLASGAWPPLLLASLVGWIAVLVAGGSRGMPAICGMTGGAADDWRALETFLAFHPPASLVLPWLLMLLAMMPPLLAQPFVHLWRGTLRRRRWRAALVFAFGYGGIWMLAGAVLIAASVALKVLAPSWLALWGATALAVLWQATPAKQACLNRCHRLPALSAFGLAAERDCLRYGMSAGLWCVGACWALMLVPLVAGRLSVAAMAAVSLLMLLERLLPPRPVRWQLPWQGVRRLWAA
jgi:predicted metal-binding membrane protein